jgi:hypothetical protein
MYLAVIETGILHGNLKVSLKDVDWAEGPQRRVQASVSVFEAFALWFLLSETLCSSSTKLNNLWLRETV